MIFKTLLSSFLLFVAVSAQSKSFDFNEQCRNAYNCAVALKLSESSKLLQEEKAKNGGNLIPVYLENYIDFLTVYTSDSRTVYEQLKKRKEPRLAELETGNTSSPYFLFTQAEVNLQWAALNLKFGEYLSAVFGIRKAYKLLEQNRRLFPNFRANEKSLGVLYALLGSVPDKYKWGLNMLGMEGNIELGMNYLNGLISYSKTNDFIFRDETVIYYSFLLLNLKNDGDSAWNLLVQNGFPHNNNLMDVYVCAHVGIYGKHNDEALQILNGGKGEGNFVEFPFLDYLKGLALLNSLNDGAASEFKKFLVEYKGENHVKAAFQKIAWCSLLQGDTANYRHFIDKAEHLGAAVLDADKQAKREAEAKRISNVYLLKARLLFDGGYYERAYSELAQRKLSSLNSPEDATEYLYRMGRIDGAVGKKDSAIAYYNQAIDKGKNLTRYFAAGSAIEAGKIYEDKGDKGKAGYYYHLCLSFSNHEYKDGLDQKAKAGLNRLKN